MPNILSERHQQTLFRLLQSNFLLTPANLVFYFFSYFAGLLKGRPNHVDIVPEAAEAPQVPQPMEDVEPVTEEPAVEAPPVPSLDVALLYQKVYIIISL